MKPRQTVPPRCTGPAIGTTFRAADALLKAGAKVNAANDLGATALWAAESERQ